jgi:hypothetical protein
LDNTLSVVEKVISGWKILSPSRTEYSPGRTEYCPERREFSLGAERVKSVPERVYSRAERVYSRAERVPSGMERVASAGKNGAFTEKTTGEPVDRERFSTIRTIQNPPTRGEARASRAAAPSHHGGTGSGG